MVLQIFTFLFIAIFIAFVLWKVFEDARDWKLFGHYAPDKFAMNLSTPQALGIFRHTPGITAIDVRPQQQFNKRHLPDALNAPYVNSHLDSSMIDHLDRSIPILVYCDGGYRSRNALKSIEASGFSAVYHLNRGFKMWRLFGGPDQSGVPTRESKKPTNDPQ